MTASAIPHTSGNTFITPRRYTVAEYIQREIETNQKHIYKNGIIIPMAGGTPPHTRISGNVFAYLKVELKPRRTFEVFNSEMKIHIPSFGFYNYADACVVCEKANFTNDDAQALANPLLIIEILSKSTRNYDQKGKFDEYKTIPSFCEYVLIESGKPLVKTYFKNAEGIWSKSNEVSGIDNHVWLESIGISLPILEIYDWVSFETL